MGSEVHVRRAAVVCLSMLLMLLVSPAVVAHAQYPPPTPTPTTSPTTGTEIECTVEAGPDFLIIECTADGFGPGAEVLAEVLGVGCNVPAALAPGVNAAPLPGEELLVSQVLSAADDGGVSLGMQVSCCDAGALHVLLTGVTPAGNPIEVEEIIDDPGVLACASGTLGSGGGLSSTGAEWLRWLTLGLVLVTAGAWIANVRDERDQPIATP